ncbi:MAG TPA: DUF72 domain-containing protein [Candidatus Obscuribacterales bacterium]
MLCIGTSGWNYDHWRGRFYPPKLPPSSFLRYYAEEFDSAEVNYSFYRLPKEATYRKWASTVPRDFIFALKVSRFISHVKRLRDASDAFHKFVDNALALEQHLGPLLLQCPENFHADTERLKDFLRMAGSISDRHGLRLVFEFRHRSWFDTQVYALLERHNAALVIADSPDYPRHDIVTADFAYYRFHGRRELFASSYTRSELEMEAKRILKLARQGLDIYGYFNNDANAHAISNARLLKQLLQA